MKPDRPPYRVKIGVIATPELYPGTASQPEEFTVTDKIQPVFFTVGSNGEIGELRLEELPTGYGLISTNTPVQVFSLDYSADKNNPTESANPIFDGIVVKSTNMISGDRTLITHVAYNRADDFLRRAVMYGQWWKDYTTESNYFNNGVNPAAIAGNSAWVEKPLIFNPQGNANCSQQRYLGDNNQDVWVFDQEARIQNNGGGLANSVIASIPWTIRRALTYLRYFAYMEWAIDPASWDDTTLAGIFGDYDSQRDCVLYNLNLNGKNIAGCLREILEPFNYGFSISPALNSNGLHDIRIWTKSVIYDYDSNTELLAPEDAGAIAVDSGGIISPNCIQAEIIKDSTPVVDDVWVIGDYLNITTLASNYTDPNFPAARQMPLVQGWQTADLTWDLNTDGTVNSSGPLYQNLRANIGGSQVYGVGRIWIVNTGENSTTPIADLESVFNNLQTSTGDLETITCVNDVRKIQPPQYYTKNKNDNKATFSQFPVFVEISTDNGLNWTIVDNSKYELIEGVTGIVFTDQDLSDIGVNINSKGIQTNYWQALHDNSLKIRIICSVNTDDRVVAIRDRQNWYSGDSPLATQRIYENLGYQRYFFETAVEDTVTFQTFEPYVDQIDDSVAMDNLAKKTMDTTAYATYSGSIILFLDTTQTQTMIDTFAPGMVVQYIYNRMDLSDNPPAIVKQVFDLINRSCQLAVSFEAGVTIIGNKDNNDSKQTPAGTVAFNRKMQEASDQINRLFGGR